MNFTIVQMMSKAGEMADVMAANAKSVTVRLDIIFCEIRMAIDVKRIRQKFAVITNSTAVQLPMQMLQNVELANASYSNAKRAITPTMISACRIKKANLAAIPLAS